MVSPADGCEIRFCTTLNESMGETKTVVGFDRGNDNVCWYLSRGIESETIISEQCEMIFVHSI